MRYLKNDCTDPHWNMAFDEYCLESLPLDEPLFYLWQNAPAVIIGLNQNVYNEVNLKYLKENGITLARRVTGGGAVYHDLQNLNYTIVGRSRDLEKDCPGYMHYVIDALRSLGVNAELSGRNDIMVDSRKVSGYAKRVYKDRLMVHGTLMYDVDLDALTRALATDGSKLQAAGIASVRGRVANLKDYLPQFHDIKELQGALEYILSRGHLDSELTLSPSDLASVRSIRDRKFATWEWIYSRSPKASRNVRAKFPSCGTVEVALSVEHGLISQLDFGGDFIGNLPPDELATALEGCRFEYGEVCKVLSDRGVADYFDSCTPEEIARLICGE